MENTKPNSQKALGSLTSTVLDEGAQSAIHTSQPESSNVSLVVHRIIAARIVHKKSFFIPGTQAHNAGLWWTNIDCAMRFYDHDCGG